MNKNEILYEIKKYADENLNKKKFIPGKSIIPASSPSLSSDDIVAIASSALEFWFTEGKWCKRFSDALAKQQEKHFALLCNSGSSASLLAIAAMKEFWNIEDGALILTCATTFPTTISSIYQNNLIPYYVDIDPITLFPRIDQVNEAKYTKYVFLAHTLGFPFCELDVNADKILISDCCDALGAEYFSAPVGLSANIQIHSFFPAHIITTGEGGAVLSNDDELMNIALSLSNWGRSCFCAPGQSNTCGKRFGWDDLGNLPEGWDHKYIFDRLGYNLKMTELQAALGYSQLLRLEEFKEKRLNNQRFLYSNLVQYNEYLRFVAVPTWSNPNPFGFVIGVRDTAPFSSSEMIKFLEERKISTRRVFSGNITRQPGYMNLPYEVVDNLSGSDWVMNNMFWIGCHPALTEEMLSYMIEVFDDFMKGYKL